MKGYESGHIDMTSFEISRFFYIPVYKHDDNAKWMCNNKKPIMGLDFLMSVQKPMFRYSHLKKIIKN